MINDILLPLGLIKRHTKYETFWPVKTTKKETTVPDLDKGVESSLWNRISPSALDSKLNERYPGCIKGRITDVIPYIMEPVGGSLSKIGVELTDSQYFVFSMHIMTRMGSNVLKVLGGKNDFVKFIHSMGVPLPTTKIIINSWSCDPERANIAHFLDKNEICSFRSGYGGNSLMRKKCLVLRLDSIMGYNNEWLAEHMMTNEITRMKPQTKELERKIPKTRSNISLKETIKKIVKESREKKIDSLINLGSIDLFSADEIADSGFKHLLLMNKCLFVQCTESDIHYTGKMSISSSFSCKNNGGSTTNHSNEMRIPYLNKYTCGSVQMKYMDAGIYVVESKFMPIVAGEVGYKGQNLEELCKVLANYLIAGSTIEVTVGLWICPKSPHFKAKIFVLRRLLIKNQEEMDNIKKAVKEKAFDRYKTQCVVNTTKDFFGDKNNNRFGELSCELLKQEDITEENLDTDFKFECLFTDHSNVERHFKILFKAMFKREIFQMWRER